jgi:hypothetical protein
MENKFLVLLMAFLLVTLLTGGLVVAESNEDEGSIVTKTKINTDYDKDGTKIVRKTITEIRDGVEVTRNVVTKIKDGQVVREIIKERKKFVDADGKAFDVKLDIKERMENGMKKRLFRANEDGLEARTELEISENESADGNVIVKVKTKDGKEKVIKVLPDRASEIAKARLKAKFGNESLEIREIKHKNLPRVVYHLEGNSSGKFLGIVKTHMNVKTDIDAETGEVVVVKRPWWAFMVRTESETEVSA